MHIVKNDVVKVLTGKYSGKTGKVLKVFPDQQRLIVEGVPTRIGYKFIEDGSKVRVSKKSGEMLRS